MPNQWSPKRQPIYVIGPSIAYLPLTQGYFATLSLPIPSAILQSNWRIGEGNGGIYAYCTLRKRKVVEMATLLVSPPLGMVADHKNRSPLDNRVENIRIATKSQNAMNRPIAARNKTGVKGVCPFKARGTYVVEVKIKGTKPYWRYFKTIPEAAAFRSTVMRELQGEFYVE